MGETLRISIITPSFNQGRFIKDTIESVLNQGYENFEHLIIDGGSTDGTVQILKQYAHLKWVSEKDNGQAHAINKGFSMATGDIVAWINSDDYYAGNVFENIATFFLKNPECKILYGNIIYVGENKNYLGKIIGDKISFRNLFNNPDVVRQPSTFWRQSLFSEVGYLDENLHIVMDYDFFLRVAQKERFYYLNRDLSYFRSYESNKTTSLHRKQALEIYSVWKKRIGNVTLFQRLFFIMRYSNFHTTYLFRIFRCFWNRLQIKEKMKRRVLFVAHDSNINGSLISLSWLVKAFVKYGYEVFVQIPPNDKAIHILNKYGAICLTSFQLSTKSLGLNLHFSNKTPFFSLHGIVLFLEDIVKFCYGVIVTGINILIIRPDVVYINEYVMLQASFISYILGVPSVCHIRSRFLERQFPLRRKLIAKMLLKLNRFLFAITPCEKKQIEDLVSPSEKIIVIPEFINPDNILFSQSMSDSFDEKNKVALTILMLGGIDPLKGTLDYLIAAKEINKLVPQAKFALAGRAVTKKKIYKQYYLRCNEIIQELCKQKALTVYGELLFANDLIKESDILVSCNKESHFSRPIIEAWSLKKCVIATNTEHNLNLVNDGIDGLLYSPGDTADLILKLHEVICNQHFRFTLANNGYNKVLRDFLPEENENAIIKLCDSVASEKI